MSSAWLEKNDEERAAFAKEYEHIHDRLEKAVAAGEINDYTNCTICETTAKVATHAAGSPVPRQNRGSQHGNLRNLQNVCFFLHTVVEYRFTVIILIHGSNSGKTSENGGWTVWKNMLLTAENL